MSSPRHLRYRLRLCERDMEKAADAIDNLRIGLQKISVRAEKAGGFRQAAGLWSASLALEAAVKTLEDSFKEEGQDV